MVTYDNDNRSKHILSQAILITFVAAIATYFFAPLSFDLVTPPHFTEGITSGLGFMKSLSIILNLIVILIGTLAINLMDRHYDLTRIRSQYTLYFYVILSLFTSTKLTFFSYNSLLSLFFILLFYILLPTFQKNKPQSNIFFISVLITIGEFFWPPMYLYFIWLIISQKFLGSFSFKGVLASLIGIVTVVWIVYTFSWAFDLSFTIQNLWDKVICLHFQPIWQGGNLTIIPIYAVALIITLISLFITQIAHKQEGLMTQTINKVVISGIVFTLIFMTCLSQYMEGFLVILTLLLSIQIGHSFDIIRQRTAHTMLIVFSTILILLFIWNILQILPGGAIWDYLSRLF